MSEAISAAPDKNPKEPLWYTKASREAKRDGERLMKKILDGILLKPIEEVIASAPEEVSEYMPFGLLHQACVGMAELTYQSSVKGVQHAAKERNKPHQDPQGANKHAYRRVYKIARNLEHNLGEITPAMIRDAIMEEVTTEAYHPPGMPEVEELIPNMLELWCKRHNVPPEHLLPTLVKQHKQNIENRNRSVKLDAESAMVMPRRFVDKVWTPTSFLENHKTYAVHVLDTDAQLDLEGFMMDNCVGGDSWKEQIKLRSNGKPETIILSIGSEVPDGISMEHIKSIYNRLMEGINQEQQEAENILVEEQMSYLEDRDGERRRTEIQRDYDSRREELEKKIKLKVCRIPEITIEYNVDSGRIMQIVGPGNAEVTGRDTFAPILLEALAEIGKRIPIRDIEGLDEIQDGPLSGCVLTSEGIAKKPSELTEGEAILWHPKTYFPDESDTVADVRAWARLPVEIEASLLEGKQRAALTEVEGSVNVDGIAGDSYIVLPNLRVVKRKIHVLATDRLELPELVEAEEIVVIPGRQSRFDLRNTLIIAPKFDQSRIVFK